MNVFIRRMGGIAALTCALVTGLAHSAAAAPTSDRVLAEGDFSAATTYERVKLKNIDSQKFAAVCASSSRMRRRRTARS